MSPPGLNPIYPVPTAASCDEARKGPFASARVTRGASQGGRDGSLDLAWDARTRPPTPNARNRTMASLSGRPPILPAHSTRPNSRPCSCAHTTLGFVRSITLARTASAKLGSARSFGPLPARTVGGSSPNSPRTFTRKGSALARHSNASPRASPRVEWRSVGMRFPSSCSIASSIGMHAAESSGEHSSPRGKPAESDRSASPPQLPRRLGLPSRIRASKSSRCPRACSTSACSGRDSSPAPVSSGGPSISATFFSKAPPTSPRRHYPGFLRNCRSPSS